MVFLDAYSKPYSTKGIGIKKLGLFKKSLLSKLAWKFMLMDSFCL